MAEDSGQEKTEEASDKKLKEAREKGQVSKSTELNSLGLRAGGTITLLLTKGYISNSLNSFSKKIFTEVSVTTFSTQYIIDFLRDVIFQFMLIMAPLLAILVAVSFVVNIAQVGFSFSMKAAAPKANKLNFLKNAKNLFFSSRSMVETLKSLMKLILISYLTYTIIFEFIIKSTFLPGSSIFTIMDFLSESSTSLSWKLLLCFAVIAFADFAYQKHKFKKDVMMTKQEVKEEMKDSEGNPQVKGAIKRIQMQMSRRRMMSDVPKADVVITNPTHYAIALKYNLQKDNAPKVLAKGVDEVAQRIKKIAVEHNIPLHEDRELARSLYKYCEPGDNIPENLFKAVARILAYVYSMKQNKRKSIV